MAQVLRPSPGDGWGRGGVSGGDCFGQRLHGFSNGLPRGSKQGPAEGGSSCGFGGKATSLPSGIQERTHPGNAGSSLLGTF